MIYGPIQENGVWKIRYNHELYQLYKYPDIAKKTGAKRLEWAAHVERGEQTYQLEKYSLVTCQVIRSSK